MLGRYRPLLWLLALLVLGSVLAGTLSGTITQRIAVVFFINVVLVVSLQMFMGNSGVVSFAHIGFMGIGAYATIILTLPEGMKGVVLPRLYSALAHLSAPYWLALIIAGLVTLLVAAIVGFPLMRLSGGAAVIATFALLVIIHVVLLNWTQVTNGPRTVFGVPSLTNLAGSTLWAVITVSAAYLFKHSRFGLMLRASREDEKAASSIGIDMVRVRWLAFSAAAFFAGVAGGLYAHFITSFGAGAFYLSETFLILAMLIIGGSGSVSGAVTGVFAVTLLSEGVRSVENAVNIANILPTSIAGTTEVVVSVAMILMLILRPAGLVGEREGLRSLSKPDKLTTSEAEA